MYSDRLKAVVSSHCPEEIHWTVEQVRELALRAGIGFEETGKITSIGEEEYAILNLPVKVSWTERIEDDFLIFTPEIQYEMGWFKGLPPEPKRLVLDAAGINLVRIKLPEQVVALPVPEWIQCRSLGWEKSYAETLICFQSEVESVTQSFVEELRRISRSEGGKE